VLESGVWGVFAWQADGSYPEEEALAIFSRFADALVYRETHEGYLLLVFLMRER
jgi:hypothetical protein